jgi:phosphatidate phosphatase
MFFFFQPYSLPSPPQVRYVSDFFKSRPPQPCQEDEVPERKPSLSLTLTLGDRP